MLISNLNTFDCRRYSLEVTRAPTKLSPPPRCFRSETVASSSQKQTHLQADCDSGVHLHLMLVPLLGDRVSGQRVQTTYPLLSLRLLSVDPLLQLVSEPSAVRVAQPCLQNSLRQPLQDEGQPTTHTLPLMVSFSSIDIIHNSTNIDIDIILRTT